MLLFFPIFLTFSFALSPTPTVDLNILKLFIPSLFIIWLIKSLFQKKIIIDNRPRFWLLITFLTVTFLSIIWSPAQTPAFRKLLFFVSTIPLYFVFYQAQQNKKFLLRFLKILIVSTFFASLLALIPFILQFIIGLNPVLNFLRQFIAPFFLGHSLANLVNQYSSWLVNISGHTILRTFGTFPDPHLFSLYLAMILPLTLYFYQRTNQKKYLFYFSTILLTILFSFSRGAYLSLIIGGLFLFLTNRPFNLLRKHLLFFYSLFVIILFLVIIPNPLTNRLSSSFSIQEGSNNGRLEMWLVALNTIEKHPLIGVGLAGFADRLDSSLGIRNPIYAHNLLLDFGAETGIINMFILLFLITSPIIFYLTTKLSLKNQILSKYLALSFLIFFVHSLFETPFFSIHVFPLFLILLAINPTYSSHSKE